MRISKYVYLLGAAGSNLGGRGFRRGIVAIVLLAEAALVVMMVLTGADVILRSLNRPIPGATEVTEYMMAVCIGIGLAYCAIQKGHVRVDVLYRLLPERIQAILSTFTGILGLGVFSLITWRTFVQMSFIGGNSITSPVLSIPRAPFLGVVGVGCGLVSLVLLADLIEYLSKAIRK